MRKISLRIPDELYYRLNLLSQKEGSSLSATIVSLIDEKILLLEIKSKLSTIERITGFTLNYIYEIRQQKAVERFEKIK